MYFVIWLVLTSSSAYFFFFRCCWVWSAIQSMHNRIVSQRILMYVVCICSAHHAPTFAASAKYFQILTYTHAHTNARAHIFHSVHSLLWIAIPNQKFFEKKLLWMMQLERKNQSSDIRLLFRVFFSSFFIQSMIAYRFMRIGWLYIFNIQMWKTERNDDDNDGDVEELERIARRHVYHHCNSHSRVYLHLIYTHTHDGLHW